MLVLRPTKPVLILLFLLAISTAGAAACQGGSSSAADDTEPSGETADEETGSIDEVDTREDEDTGEGRPDWSASWPYECDNDPGAENDYEYLEPAVGLLCSASEPCGESAVCSNAMFPEDQGYTSAQCYPACQMEGPETSCCATGDVCVVLKEGTFACLARGAAVKDSLTLKILPKGTKVNHADVAYVGAKVSLDGKNIPINMSYIIEETADFDGDGRADDVVIVELEGVAGIAGTWVFQITVPKEKWAAGELVLKPGEAGDFDAVLTKWVGQKMTVKAASHAGAVTIVDPGAPCEAAPCDKAKLGFDIDLFAIEAAR